MPPTSRGPYADAPLFLAHKSMFLNSNFGPPRKTQSGRPRVRPAVAVRTDAAAETRGGGPIARGRNLLKAMALTERPRRSDANYSAPAPHAHARPQQLSPGRPRPRQPSAAGAQPLRAGGEVQAAPKTDLRGLTTEELFLEFAKKYVGDLSKRWNPADGAIAQLDQACQALSSSRVQQLEDFKRRVEELRAQRKMHEQR
jgi:hypothetical protein